MDEIPGNSSEANKTLSVRFAGIVIVGTLAVLALLFFVSSIAPSFAGNVFSSETITTALNINRKPRQALAPAYDRFDFRLAGDETFFSIMSMFDVPSADISEIARAVAPVYDLRLLKKGAIFRVYSQNNAWKSFEYAFGDYSVLRVENRSTHDRVDVSATVNELAHETRRVAVAGTIESSLFEDATKVGVDPTTIIDLSEIFAWDIDFASDIRRGDTFKVVYEQIYVEGKPLRAGRVVGAEMSNDGKVYTAVYFENNSTFGYFDPEGRSLSRNLLKSPLRYKRISSRFSRRRYHPILKMYREHHGIDYAAPTGTPIEAAGSGRVQFAGWKSGYGNFIEVKHTNGYVTAYGHLSRIRDGIRVGRTVSQGDVIGYVGSTGISTGPHLHYEVRVNGRVINPLLIKPKPNNALAAADLARFNEGKGAVIGALAAVKPSTGSALLASN